MMERWDRRNVAHLLGFVVLLAVVVPFVIFAVPAVIGGDASHVVLSGSMAPAISAGDVIVTTGVDAGEIEQGDVITFRAPGEQIPTTHRVVDVVDDGEYTAFHTKGDANEDPDPQPVPADEVLGEVILVIPYIGRVILFASTAEGMILFLGVPFGLLILTEAWSLATNGATPSEGSDEESAKGKLPDGKSDTGDVDSTDGGPVPVESGDSGASRSPETGPESAAIEDGAEEATSSTLVVTRTDLKITLLVSGLFFAYALFTLYQQWIVQGRRRPVTMAVAVGATAGFILLVALYYGTTTAEDTDETGAPGGNVVGDGVSDVDGPAGAAATESVPRSDSANAGDDVVTPSGGPPDSVEVESVEALRRTAEQSKTPIRWYPWRDTFELVPATQAYVYSAADDQAIRPPSPSDRDPTVEGSAEVGSTKTETAPASDAAGIPDSRESAGRQPGSDGDETAASRSVDDDPESESGQDTPMEESVDD